MTDTKGNWWDAFPAPRSEVPTLERKTALAQLSSPELLLIDVRRTDYEGGTVRGSLNIPAHSFYLNRAVLYDIVKRAGIKKVAFYCGARSAKWFADFLHDKEDTSIESYILEGGIKGWVAAGDEYIKAIDGYEADKW
ncbi:Rhodanese-like domain-containing protein [Dendryphion nanum]|uniref:Rhodanese-like domain-containing protein n=1 Tax=Dendryphion nanum TaxID=256645 RepID=A0A9P9DQE8_9PLEO|nr:Rhodanese-like domain-containing protein [Dendryphion nanum]